MNDEVQTIDQDTGEIIEDQALIVAPSTSPAQYIKNVQVFAEFMKSALTEGKHYGKLPKVKGKMLFQSGAEIIGKYFAIGCTQTLIGKTEDFEHGFFSYTYEATGIHIPTQLKVASVQRTCSSYETKYLYKWTGSYGNKSKVRKTSEELAGDINTYMAMAQKRAHTAMIRQATAASEFFQDEADEAPPGKQPKGQTVSAKENPARVSLLRAIFAIAGKLGYSERAIKERAYACYTKGKRKVTSMHDLTMDELREIKVALQKQQAG